MSEKYLWRVVSGAGVIIAGLLVWMVILVREQDASDKASDDRIAAIKSEVIVNIDRQMHARR